MNPQVNKYSLLPIHFENEGDTSLIYNKKINETIKKIICIRIL